MSVVLALDTAADTVGAALAVVSAAGAAAVRAELVEASPTQHSRRVLQVIDAVLDGAGVAKGDISCVAVTRGPGSFTGLRVGVATAKGLAYALGVPVVGVSTLEALASRALPFPGVVASLLDARKHQLYGAAWDGQTGALLVAEGAWDPPALAAELARFTRPVLALGSGLGTYGPLLREALGERLLATDPSRWPIPPRQVALLGVRELEAGRAVDPALFVPVYCRLSEAEEKKRVAALGGGFGG